MGWGDQPWCCARAWVRAGAPRLPTSPRHLRRLRPKATSPCPGQSARANVKAVSQPGPGGFTTARLSESRTKREANALQQRGTAKRSSKQGLPRPGVKASPTPTFRLWLSQAASSGFSPFPRDWRALDFETKWSFEDTDQNHAFSNCQRERFGSKSGFLGLLG